MIRSKIGRWQRAYMRLQEKGGDPDGDTLIVFHNSMFDTLLGLNSLSGPTGVRFSGNRLRWKQADAVVFHIPTLARLPESKPLGQLWVAWTMESEANYPQLADPQFMASIDLEMTYRQDADVWLPYLGYYSLDMPALLLRPPGRKRPNHLINSFVSSNVNHSKRLEFLAELNRHVDVHAYGSIGYNRKLTEDRGRASKLKAIAGYKFTIAFENSIAEDYVTEKFYDPLLAGSVPVYLGAPNVAEFAPGEHCYIDVKDFSDPKALAAYLQHLDSDDEAYNAYHTWRQKPLLPAFEAKMERRRKTGHPFEALGKIVVAGENASI